MAIKAIIFDFDGLILDTETPEFHSWQEIYAQYGAELSLEEWVACVGTTQEVFDPIENLQARSNQTINPDQTLKVLHEKANRHIARQPILPGILDYLNEAKQLNLKIGLSSSSTREWVTGHLSRLNLLDYFDVICTSDDVKAVKPDPALYRCAAESLNLEPQAAIALEDSLNGMLSAKQAGLHCFVIPNPITRYLDFKGADGVFTALTDISLADLIERCNGDK